MVVKLLDKKPIKFNPFEVKIRFDSIKELRGWVNMLERDNNLSTHAIFNLLANIESSYKE